MQTIEKISWSYRLSLSNLLKNANMLCSKEIRFRKVLVNKKRFFYRRLVI